MKKDKFWKGKRVFVTGASGFTGSWLTKALVDNSAEVVALVRDWNPKSILLGSNYTEKINMVRGDLEDLMLIKRALNEFEIDTVFHLGAQSQVENANMSPVPTFKTNIEGTWNVLEAARENGWIERVVVASSDKAYGTHKDLPYQENYCLKGDYPYEVSKSCADLIARAFYKTYGLPVTVTRMANIFGGGDLNFQRIIPGASKALINNKHPIIYGTGKDVERDFIYVEDAVNSYLTLGKKTKEVAGEAFNFGYGKPRNLLEVVKGLIEVSRKNSIKPKILPTEKRKGEIDKQYVSIKKAKKLLKWKPEVEFKEGLKRTYKWYKNFLK